MTIGMIYCPNRQPSIFAGESPCQYGDTMLTLRVNTSDLSHSALTNNATKIPRLHEYAVPQMVSDFLRVRTSAYLNSTLLNSVLISTTSSACLVTFACAVR